MKVAAGMALVLLLAYAAEVHAQADNFTSIYLARWNLTHGKYQVDIGEYLEALEAFDTALETTDDVDVRTDALLQKANLLALFLDAPDDAIRVYDDLLTQYPASPAADAALYRAGMVLFDREQYERAARYFERYLKEHPSGASRGSVEFLLQQSRSKVAALPPTAPPAPAASLPPAPPPQLAANRASATSAAADSASVADPPAGTASDGPIDHAGQGARLQGPQQSARRIRGRIGGDARSADRPWSGPHGARRHGHCRRAGACP